MHINIQREGICKCTREVQMVYKSLQQVYDDQISSQLDPTNILFELNIIKLDDNDDNPMKH
jgi:hypothetical protein